MYYTYFLFAAILASLMWFECRTKNLPQWWAAMVFASPVTTPYFIYKSRKEAGMTLIVVFLCAFSIVSVLEFFLYSRYMEKNKYTALPPITRQIIILSDALKQSTINLDNALIQLENLSKVESRIHELEKTIKFIDKLRTIKIANDRAIDRLVLYTREHKAYFAKQDMAWVFNIQFFYKNRTVIQHYKSLSEYLDRFEELLRYTHLNFYNITEVKNPEALKNYDEYYLRYRRAVDTHNRFNVKRIEFQNDFLKKYPDIKPYLPGERQTDTFRLWGE